MTSLPKTVHVVKVSWKFFALFLDIIKNNTFLKLSFWYYPPSDKGLEARQTRKLTLLRTPITLY